MGVWGAGVVGKERPHTKQAATRHPAASTVQPTSSASGHPQPRTACLLDHAQLASSTTHSLPPQYAIQPPLPTPCFSLLFHTAPAARGPARLLKVAQVRPDNLDKVIELLPGVLGDGAVVVLLRERWVSCTAILARNDAWTTQAHPQFMHCPSPRTIWHMAVAPHRACNRPKGFSSSQQDPASQGWMPSSSQQFKSERGAAACCSLHPPTCRNSHHVSTRGHRPSANSSCHMPTAVSRCTHFCPFCSNGWGQVQRMATRCGGVPEEGDRYRRETEGCGAQVGPCSGHQCSKLEGWACPPPPVSTA